MKFLVLFSCLCLALTLASASTFEISKTDLVLINSKLDGVELISARPVFSTANTTHTTHFFYIVTKNEKAKESLLSITPVGFRLKKSNVISTNITEYIKTIDYVEEEEIIKNETYYDIEYTVDELNSSITKEKNISKIRQYSEITYVNKTENISTVNFSFDNTKIANTIKSDAGSYLIEIMTEFGEQGSFNPNVSACAELNESNGIYNLTQNVSIDGSTCFTITAPNVTLDCNGYSITGIGNTLSAYGVYTNQYNTTIKNCNIHNFDASVRLSGTYGVVKDSNITTNYTSAGYGRAIIITGSSNLVSNSYLYEYNGGGTYSDNGNDNTIVNSTVVGNSTVAMRMSSTNSRIINVTVLIYTSSYGIYHTTGSNLSVDCQGASITGSNSSSTYGVYSTQLNTTVKNCRISNFSTGIYINDDSADYANITNNTINLTYATSCGGTTGVCDAIFGSGADYVTISNNNINAYNFGVANFNEANDWIIENNNITTQAGNAVYLYSTNRNLVNKNNISTNGQYAIYLRSKEGHNITHNTISTTSDFGISVNTGHSNVLIEYNNITAGNSTIYITNSNNATIRHNNLSAVTHYALRFTNANDSIASNNTLMASTYSLRINGNNNILSNNRITSTGNLGVYFSEASDTLLTNNTISAPTGVYLTSAVVGSNNNNITYNNISYNITSSPGGGIHVYSTSNNTLIEGNTIIPQYSNSSHAIYVSGTSYYTKIINNSMNTSITSYSTINIVGSNSEVYYNNISGSSWISNSGTNNSFNSSGIGNIYYFANGTPSWEVYNIYDTNSDNWADVGANRPFNSSLTEWSGSGADWHPYTLNTNYSIRITQNVSFTNATVGHWFYANATAYNPAGYNQTSNISASSGTCSLVSSTQTNWTLAVVYNCTAQTPSTATINITFFDVYQVRNSTQANNSYADPNIPVLTAPNISGTASVGYTLTCNAGNFSDADGDIENVSATTWRWFNGTTPIANATSQTWLVPLWYNGAVIKCEQNVTAQNWTTSQASNNSSAVTISNANPVNATLENMINATTSHQFNITAYADDADGAQDITVWNMTSTHGTCSFLSNTTGGNRRTVLINCYAQSEGTTELNITFADFNGLYNWTAKNFTYIDHEANLSAPFITPISNNSAENLTCNLGNWSDIDGDLENTSARSFRWFVNGLDINVSAQVLANGNFTTGDYISCEQFSQAQNWTTSNITVNSTEIYISNQSVNLVIVSPYNGSLISSCNFTALIFTGFQNGTTSRTATCNLSYNGQFITTQTKNVSNGFSTYVFYNLTNNGNYSITCQAQDSFSVSQTVSVHTQYYDMTACYADFYKKTSNTTTTFLYSKFEIEYFNVSEVLGVMLLGLAMFGMVSYATRLRKGNIFAAQS